MATNFTKKTAAIALAAGLAFSGSAGIVAAPVAQAQSISDIAAEQGSITVHKYKNPSAIADSTNGRQATTDELANAGTALEGAKFKVTKVDQAVNTAEAFSEAAKLTPAGVKDKLTNTTYDLTTDTNGSATTGKIDAGVYLVEEQPSDALTAAMVPAAPFLVFVPMTGGPNNTWLRDVHVYPKNTELTNEKKVQDANQHPFLVEGEDEQTQSQRTLSYTINSNVPVLPENRELKSFNIVDSYNKDELTLDLANATVTMPEVALTKGADYDFVGPEATSSEDGKVNQKVTVRFTQAGLDKLNANQGKTVTFQVDGTVNKVAQGESGTGIQDGEVTNRTTTDGRTNVKGRTDLEDEPFNVPEKEVHSYFGALRIIKQDEKGDPLNGARFQIFTVPASTQGDDAAAKCESGKRTNVGNEFTVNENGEKVINALHVTDVVDNQEVEPASQLQYCVVETAAPSGYVKDDTAKPFTITMANATEPTRTTTLTYSDEVTIQNNRGVTLPGTGGMGVIAIILAGLALLGGGAYAARRKTA